MARPALSRRLRSLLLFAIAGALGSTALFIQRNDLPQPGRAEDPSSGQHVPATLVSKTRRDIPGGRTVVTPPPASEALQRMMPGQEEHIADWRAFAPETFTVRFDDALVATYRVDRVERDASRTVLTARLTDGDLPEAAPLGGAFLVATANASDRWDAVAAFPGLEYHITVRGASIRIQESPTLTTPCATDLAADADFSATVPDPISAADHGSDIHVDVLFLYNQRALSERNGDTLTIDADASNYIASSNTVLENSRITGFRWRHVGTIAAPAYADNDDTAVDLRSMSSNGEIASFVRSTQRSYGADQVVMLVGGAKTDAVGRAWLGGSVAHSVVNYPFPTFSDGSRSTATTSYATTCHELGHNFGCQHQRQDSSTNAADGDGKFNYGFVFPRGGGEIGTIMTVFRSPTPLARIPYFSSPELTFDSTTIGVAAGEPRAAHNARTMADNVARVAALESTVSAPVITQQPASLTASIGQRATFSVSATGGDLSYAWTKDGAPLPVETSSFSVASVSAASAGTYAVTVSNRLGSTTSQPAVLTVNAATTPSPTASSGGGGGGGSTGWLLASGLVAWRLLLHRRRC